MGQEFYWGINDPLGADHTGRPFDPDGVHALRRVERDVPAAGDPVRQARAAIARGQEIFNHKPLAIVGVVGPERRPRRSASIPGTCTTCHDTPNAGNHSVPAPLRIGIDAVQPVVAARRRAAGLHAAQPGHRRSWSRRPTRAAR